MAMLPNARCTTESREASGAANALITQKDRIAMNAKTFTTASPGSQRMEMRPTNVKVDERQIEKNSIINRIYSLRMQLQ